MHKPGTCGSGRVCANVWNVFHRTPCRGGCGRRPAVDLVVCFRWGGIFWVIFFLFEHTHGLLQVRGRLAPCTSLLPACSTVSANAPKPRTFEVSLIWAREVMTMTTYTNVVLYVLSLWFIKNEMRIACFLGTPI